MSSPTSITEYRDALLESIRTGVLSVTVGGQTTTFASLAERQQVLNRINAEIAATTGAATARPVASTIKLGGF